MTDIILASQSPRRQELMNLITPSFRCIVSDVEEICPPGLTAAEECSLFAEQKCDAVAKEHPDSLVIGCDTVVEACGEALGKPKDKEDARRMMKMLMGATHNVITAVCVKYKGEKHRFNTVTEVRFFPMEDAAIEEYISTDEPYDKAGGYGVQRTMSRYLDALNGDYFNVMGLPVSRLFSLLKELKVL